MEPGIKRATTLEAIDRAIYLNENLLGYVISVSAISKDPVCEPANLGLITFDEVAKRPSVDTQNRPVMDT
jgi:hypothetical protein